jgi:hypothetical protein
MSKKLNDIISIEEYFNELIIVFPVLTEIIVNENGNHSKMEVFADYTIKQIKTNNILELRRCFDFQEEKIPICPAAEDAMVVSYCESLLLGEVASLMHNFICYMKPRLFKMYNDYNLFYNNLAEKSRNK